MLAPGPEVSMAALINRRRKWFPSPISWTPDRQAVNGYPDLSQLQHKEKNSNVHDYQ